MSSVVNGIQHIGLGVRNREESYRFYNNALGFSVLMSKSTDTCTGMLPVLGSDELRDVLIALNPYGGALVEIFQYISKQPEPIPEEVDFSYNGFLFYGIKVKNISRALEIVRNHGGTIVTGPSSFSPMLKAGWKTAVFKDPDGIHGIMLEYPGSTVGYGNGRPKIGGIEYIAIGVSNLNQSIDFYSSVLGYNVILYQHDGNCKEWETLFGKDRRIKRALLVRGSKPQGLFRHFLRGGMIELIEVEGKINKHNFDGRQWGDIGCMELCFDVSDINATLEAVTKMGVSVTVPPYSQDMGLKTQATFAYIKDPDGSLLEFADIKRLPVPYFIIRLMVNPFIIGLAKKLKLIK